MKKIAKLSLVAAVAVAGLTTANAQQLEDAIKKVETTGSVVYRYNDYNNDTNADTNASQTNNYKAALGLASEVNDQVKLNSRFLVANGNGDFATLETSENGDSNVDVELSNVYFSFTGIQNTTVNVGKQGLTTPWTVAVDSDGNEQTGTGALALSTIGNVTLAAAYFNQTNLGESGNGLPGILNTKKPTIKNIADDYGYDVFNKDADIAKSELEGFNNDFYDSASDKDAVDSALSSRIASWNSTNASNASQIGALNVATVGAIVAAGPVTLDAWYADMQQLFSSYTIGAKTGTTLGDLKLGADARFTYLELDRDAAEALMGGSESLNVQDDNSLAKLTLTGDYSIFDVKVAYGKTGKEGGLTALDNDASTTLLGWGVTANNKADADYWQFVAGVDLLDNLNLSANYVNVDYTGSVERSYVGSIVERTAKTSVEEEEIYAQLTYKMSKNLSAYTRYGVYTKDTSAQPFADNAKHGDSRADSVDETRGRIQVEYTF